MSREGAWFHRLPMRSLLLGAAILLLVFSSLVWTVASIWLGESFIWHSQEYRLIALVRMVWTGEENAPVHRRSGGYLSGIRASREFPADARDKVLALSVSGNYARILSVTGERVAEPEEREGLLPPPVEVARIAELAAIPKDTHLRHLVHQSGDWMVLLLPIRPPGSGEDEVGILQMCAPIRPPREAIQDMKESILITVSLVALVSIGSALLLTRWLVIPIEKLREATSRLREGNWKARTGFGSLRSNNEVYQVAAAFDDMADRLEQSFENQRRFIADASHELKTPLTALCGMADMLRRVEDPERRSKAITIIERESNRMSRLVADLLLLSRSERTPAKQDWERLEFGLRVREAIELVEATHPHCSIEFQQEEEAFVLANGDDVTRVLRNLLENAINYSNPGSTVLVSLRRAQGWVEVSVQDHGKGIAEPDLQHLFERFYRTDSSRDRKTGGHGLGLAIVKAIVTQHGGMVSVASELGQGSTFTVRLPEAA